MYRSHSLFALLAVVLLASGCSAYAYQDVYEHPRHNVRVDVVHDAAHRDAGFYRRAEQDVQRYVRRLDQYLHLSRRQQYRIQRLLTDRIYELLDHTHPADVHHVYPFPRRYDARLDHRVERWWRQTDRGIEHVLSRRQRRAYRDLVRGHHYDRYEDGYRRYRDFSRGRGRTIAPPHSS